MYGIKDIHRFSRLCFYVCIGFGIFLISFFGIMKLLHVDVYHILPPCFFYEATHYYCFGCGGTRAVRELLHGHILRSLYYNAAIVYIAVIYLAFVTSHMVSIIIKKGKGMIFRPIYFYVAAGLIITQFFVKNFFVFQFNFSL